MERPYILIDGMLSGTGLRDAENGGYLKPEQLGLSDNLKVRLAHWLKEYANAHFFDFEDREEVKRLDDEGLSLARSVRAELKDAEVGYYSSAGMFRMTL